MSPADRLRAPGAWLWLALALGAALRLHLALATPGSFDVAIKLHHGRAIQRLGLVEYYRVAEVMNHPPPMALAFTGAAGLADGSALPFGPILRLPTALLDLGTAALLGLAFSASPWRWAILAGYWLHPLAILFSAYHGNTDTAVAFFALLALVLASRRRAVLAGAALGLGLWVKLPILLVAPALCLALPRWRERLSFALVAVGVGTVGQLPLLAQEPVLFAERILGYPGSEVTTSRSPAIWGVTHVLGLADGAAARWLRSANALVCGLPILLLAWLGRGRFTAGELGARVAGSLLLVYGLTSFFAWQYLAWSVPFWFFLDRRLAAALTLVVGAYVYGAYAFFTGDWALGARWDFLRPSWPWWLLRLRDASVLLCLAGGLWGLVQVVQERRSPAAEPTS